MPLEVPDSGEEEEAAEEDEDMDSDLEGKNYDGKAETHFLTYTLCSTHTNTYTLCSTHTHTVLNTHTHTHTHMPLPDAVMMRLTKVLLSLSFPSLLPLFFFSLSPSLSLFPCVSLLYLFSHSSLSLTSAVSSRLTVANSCLMRGQALVLSELRG